MESSESKVIKEGRAQIHEFMSGFAFFMALKSSVELGIPDILHSHSSPITLSQIASGIDSPCPNMSYLSRIMRFLVHKKIFIAQVLNNDDDVAQTLYTLPESSKWLLKDSKESLTSLLLMQANQWIQAPYHYFSQCVKETGTTPFEKAHGCKLWEFSSKNPEFSKVFNQGLAHSAKDSTTEIVVAYKDGFESVRTLVDVGGGVGKYLAAIVEAYPHIAGTNFDLPSVVATAPTFDGVSHVGGDMFESVPSADAIFMKGVLHNWSDEDCIRILKSCRNAIAKDTGKLILVEIVLQAEDNEEFEEFGLTLDMVMFALVTGGEQRSELEWKKLLKQGGFPSYKLIKLPSHKFIIEAYPA